MNCPKCHSENPDTSSFCSDCGTQLGPIEEVSVTKTLETPVIKLTKGNYGIASQHLTFMLLRSMFPGLYLFLLRDFIFRRSNVISHSRKKEMSNVEKRPHFKEINIRRKKYVCAHDLRRNNDRNDG